MAINIKFDLAGNPEPPTIILSNRNGNKLGQLKTNEDSIELIDKFNDASEISFTVNKYIDDKPTPLWDKLVDFKLIYCKEWDLWFEIKVELDEETETVKTVFGTQLGQAELSQIMLYNIEINTEEDIERDDYKIAILYDENDKDASILNRILEKAPHYSIKHVDQTIRKIQRSFSFDGTSIYDAFQEIAEEIGCLFVFHSNSDENGKIQRAISVYDLWYTCMDCGYRSENERIFVEDSNVYLIDESNNSLIDELDNHLLYRMAVQCPKCSGKKIKNGYGNDTLIFVTSDELASGGIKLTTDTDSVKNCFKLEAGDDLMTATVRNCNPNGTDYIWRFSDSLKEDMSKELVDRLDSYNEIYKQYYNNYAMDLDAKLLNGYNSLVNKYSVYNENLQTISSSVTGYSNLMNAYYNTIDLALYLKSGLMPNVKMSETNAKEQADLLTEDSLTPIAVSDIKIASLATISSTVLSVAKIIVKSTYKIQVNSSELLDIGNKRYWKGNFTITNYSDEEDTAISDIVFVEVNDDFETFIKQKIDKALGKENVDDLSITGLFDREYDEFCAELKKYALNPLISFRDACQACIDILIEQGVNGGASWSDNEEGYDSNLYEKLYIPYYNKLKAIESEIKIREDEINIISGTYDSEGNLVINGLQTNIENCRIQIQNALNFEKYLGEDLWLEFCAYRREDKFTNSNYISDGLNNAELFEKALEFFKVAENEIYKSSELQHSISTTLNNLLYIPKFKNLVKSFNVGNWIRVKVDEKIFKLRLLEYGIGFGSFNDVSVEFSDVTKIKNGVTDVQSVFAQASSMASSYGFVQRQASQGAKGGSVLNSWVENGLNATNTKIVDSYDENLLFGKNAFWCRQYDPTTGTYSDEQIKIVNSTIAITDDGWETTKTAIGKFYYVDPHTGELKSAYGINGETIVGKLLIGEQLDISNNNGGLEFGQNGLIVKNDVNTVSIDPNKESIFNISNNSGNIFSLNENGELVIVGNITASSLTLLDGTIIDSGNITGLSDVAITGSYNDLVDKPTLSDVAKSGDYNDLSNIPIKLSDFINDASFITKDVSDLTNYYKKTEVDNSYYKKTKVDSLLGLKVNSEDLSKVSTTGSYKDLVDIEELKNWVLEQISLSSNQ